MGDQAERRFLSKKKGAGLVGVFIADTNKKKVGNKVPNILQKVRFNCFDVRGGLVGRGGSKRGKETTLRDRKQKKKKGAGIGSITWGHK